MIEIKSDIHWVGVNDRRTALFENYWPLPKGVAYNSYIINDEKVALIDTVEKGHMDDFFVQVKNVLGDKKVDYLIVNHMEPDHSGAIRTLLSHYPDMIIVGNKKTFPMLKHYYGDVENKIEVAEGDTLSLGKHTLQFFMIPMVHWPESMVCYEQQTNTLFSNDAFGAFGTLDGGIFDDELDLQYLEGEISRYYSNIVGKYGLPVQAALKKLGGLTINMICPSHGPIWRSHIAEILTKYQRWSKYETEPGVVIAFSSMYGHTEAMADQLARYLVEYGVKKVRVYDTSKTHSSYIIDDIFRFNGVLLGSSAYNGGMFPGMETLLCELENMGIKNHYFSTFANMTWGGGAMKRFKEFAEKIKWEVVADEVEVSGSMTTSDKDRCRAIAKAMAEKVNG
ncbi:MAG: FprA family A-type flavoprotein [Marinifilaceae bacterium]